MKDYMIRATAAGGTVRAIASVTTEMVQMASDIHKLSPVASAALGRTLTAGAMMARFLKNETDKLTIQIKGDGPLGGIIVAATWDSKVRGYVYNPYIDLPLNSLGKLDVGGAVGKNGYLNVIKDMGLKEPYIGYVDLVSGEIGEDMAYYMAYSEQIPSVVSLGVLVDTDGSIANSGGYIIQLMPGADEELISYIEGKVQEMSSVTDMLSHGGTPESILEKVLGGRELKIVGKMDCSYACNCSRERMERNLLSLGINELKDIIAEQNGAQTECHFCNKKYNFTAEELQSLIDAQLE